MARVTVGKFPTKEEAEACLMGVAYVNESSISDPKVEQVVDGWKATVDDRDREDESE